MDVDAVVAALRALCDPESPHQRAVLEHRERDARYAEYRLDLHDLAAVLAPTLEKQKPFSDGSFMLRMGGGSAVGFHGRDAAIFLLRRVEAGRSVDEAVADLIGLVGLPSAESVDLLSLRGIELDAPIELSDELSLLPWSAIPDSPTKQWLDRPFVPHPWVPFSLISQPACAISRRGVMRPLFVKAGEWKAKPGLNELFDAALPLALIGPSGVIPGVSWLQFTDPMIACAAHGGVTRQHGDDILPSPFLQSFKLTPADVGTLVRDYLRLEGQVRDRVRVGLTRFNRALIRHNVGDKALDLAIAVELLLVDGGGENTFKVSLRAGLATHGSFEERNRARAVVEALYAVRSGVVHTGGASSTVKVRGAGQRRTDEVVTEAFRVVAGVFKRVITEGALPHWPEQELAGGDKAPVK
jgi:hypothetical protein